MALDYVKFQRGTPNEYAVLKSRDRVEENTLYFIYEKGAASGSLYLGSILIGTVGTNSDVSSLSDLSDVLLQNLGATDILMYSSDGKWKNIPLQELADLIAGEDGLGFEVDENHFDFKPVDGVSTLRLLGFDSASPGASLMKSVDGKTIAWSNNNIDDIAKEVGDLNTSIENLHKEVAQQIADANHLKYELVSSLSDMTKVNTVYLLPKSDAEEHNGYDEFMVINEQPERLGDWKVDLSGYVTTADLQGVSNALDTLSNNISEQYVSKINFNSVVGDLTQLNNYNAEEPTTLVKEINALYNLFGSSSNPSVDKVGDLTKLLTYEEGKTTTVVDEINNIYELLIWQPIVI